MPAEKTDVLVLRTIEFSETSLVVSLLTRDFGKVSAIAKGARRPKGPFEGSLDLLSVCRVILHRKPGDQLDLLTEAKLQRRFRAGERDLERLYAGYYVAELLRELTHDGDPHPELFELALETVASLDGDAPVAGTLLRFELQTLRLLGHAPRLDRCAGCGQAVVPAPRIAFGLLAGGVLCGRCRSSQRQVVSIREAVRQWLDRLQDPRGMQQPPPDIPPDLYGELRAVVSRYIRHLVGHPLRTQTLLPARLSEATGAPRRSGAEENPAPILNPRKPPR